MTTPTERPRPGPAVRGRSPRVSVVLPLYRPGREVAVALARLAATTGGCDEVLVVDDGTPWPEGRELAHLVETHLPGASLHVRPHNAGVAAARNHALRHATGRYVWFVDWDDDWDPTILDVLVTRADATGAPVVTCRADVVDERGGLIRQIGPGHDAHLRGQETARALLDGRLEGHLWNKLFRRELLPADLFPLLPTLSDLVGTAPVLAGADRVEHVGRVLYEHRMRPGSLTATSDRDLSMLLDAGTQVPAVVLPFLHGRRDADRLAALFRHRSAYLTAVTALRLPLDAGDQATWVGRAREMLRLTEVAQLLATWPLTATRSVALLVLGQVFPPVYRGIAPLRGRLRSHRRRPPWARG